MKYFLTIATATLLFMASNANALLTNGDFETLDHTGSVFPSGGNQIFLNEMTVGQWAVFNTIPGWYSGANDAGIEIQYNTVDKQNPANRYVELDSHGKNKSMNNSSMYQFFDVTADDAGIGYYLQFDYRSRTGAGDTNNIEVTLSPGFTNPIFEILQPESENKDWVTYYVDLGILEEGEYALGFTALGTGDRLGGFIDNVSIKPVPEPTTMLLFGAGIAGLAAAGRRRKR